MFRRCAERSRSSMTILWRLAGGLLDVPGVGPVLASAARRGLEAKAAFDQGVTVVLGVLNLPSRADLQRLMTKIEVVQGTLTNLSLKMDRVLAQSAGAEDDLEDFDDPDPV
jgi:hypothetical protein